MKKSEAFKTIVGIVAYCCEVDINELTSGETGRALVDARILCTQFLWRIGFSNEEIAYYVLTSNRKMEGITTSSPEVKNKAKHINKLLNRYNARCKDWMFREIATDINKSVTEFMRENETPLSHDD